MPLHPLCFLQRLPCRLCYDGVAHASSDRALGREGTALDFVAVVDHVIALLRQRGRVTYRTLKRQFQLDDEVLEDLKEELIVRSTAWRWMRRQSPRLVR